MATCSTSTATSLATCLGCGDLRDLCGDELMLSASGCCFPDLECFRCLAVLVRANGDPGWKAWPLSLARRSWANHFTANLCFCLARWYLAWTLASLLILTTSLTKRRSLVSLSQSLTECYNSSAHACVSSAARAAFLVANCSSTSWSWPEMSVNSLLSSIYLADSFEPSFSFSLDSLFAKITADASKLSCGIMTPPNELSFGCLGIRWSVLALDCFSFSLTDPSPERRWSPTGLLVVDLMGDYDYCDSVN